MFKEFESRKCILHSVRLQSDWVLEFITQVKTVIIAGLNFFFSWTWLNQWGVQIDFYIDSALRICYNNDKYLTMIS